MFRKKRRSWEPRRFKRLRTSYLVKYQMGGKGTPRVTNVVDLSEGGVRFLAQERIPELSILNLSIYLPPLEKSVEVVAKVIRSRRAKDARSIYYVAAAFLDLRREDREAIRQFAEYLSEHKEAPSLIGELDTVLRRRKR